MKRFKHSTSVPTNIIAEFDTSEEAIASAVENKLTGMVNEYDEEGNRISHEHYAEGVHKPHPSMDEIN